MQTLTHTLAAAGLSWGVWLMAGGFTLVCIIMMLVILIQKPKGGGLSGAFGGGAGGGSAGAVVGARVGDVLTIITIVCFILFLGLAMGLTWSTTPSVDGDDTDKTSDVEGAGTTDDGEDDSDE